jgi:hypothetical protein
MKFPHHGQFLNQRDLYASNRHDDNGAEIEISLDSHVRTGGATSIGVIGNETCEPYEFAADIANAIIILSNPPYIGDSSIANFTSTTVLRDDGVIAT